MGTFDLDIAKFVEKAKGNADLVVRKVTLEMFGKVIEKSPVDTGRFKSNWQAAIGSVPTGTLGTDESVTHDENGKERERGFARSDAAADASFARVNAKALESKAGDVTYMVNNLSYANRLEYGWSGQAPAGMVRLSIAEFNGTVDKVAREVNK